ncbi:MAG: OmpA family protein [Halocynthiibacter sp.]
MRLSSAFVVLLAFLAAALFATLAAGVSVRLIEDFSVSSIDRALKNEGIDWAKASANGLQVSLSGTAPSEAARFRALSVAGGIVDAARVRDGMDVVEPVSLAPPDFSIEFLRNDDGISLIGLIPTATDRDAVLASVTTSAGGARVADLLESGEHPVPAGWDAALAYALDALSVLPRSKISLMSGYVTITAISDSAEQRARLESRLLRDVPAGLQVTLDISAPRPVLTPFTLRFVIDADGARFDACSADSEATRDRILGAARAVGLTGKADCTIGLGNPSPSWAQAVETGIAAVAEIGGGSLTFSDADVTYVAPDTTKQPLFDRVVGELEADLPDVFSLYAVLPEPVLIDGTGEGSGPPEFVATLSPEGLVQLRGRLTNERTRAAVESYARARFGLEQVYAATRLDSELPDGWPLRVLAGLQALAELNNGSVVVQPDFVDLRGIARTPGASAEVSRILSDKLGEAENFSVSVTYAERLDPIAALPTPAECVAAINAILSARKIAFSPGSADLDPGAEQTLDDIAAQFQDCQQVEMEIAGYTDSQGREEMNQALSQNRAEAVLQALMARRILTSSLVARGYGENRPIADNDSEKGREANRRIEFTLLSEVEELIQPENPPAAEGAVAPAGEGAPVAVDDVHPQPEEEPTPPPSEEPHAETGTQNEQN